jgi:hypothetical protein
MRKKQIANKIKEAGMLACNIQFNAYMKKQISKKECIDNLFLIKEQYNLTSLELENFLNILNND